VLSLSVVVPVYNERYLVCESLRRVLAAAPSWEGVSAVEVLVVEDGSTDGTRELLRDFAAAEPRITLIEHARNSGKGAAVRTGIAAAQGDLIVFHDADLEYDPRDIGRLVKPFLEDGADVVYGSRFSASERRRVLYYRHTLGNKLITFLSDMATDLNLTDVETCYKMFRSTLLKSLPIRSNDFRLEIEVTAKIAKRQARIFEVPISYVGRTYREGKKIGWKDAVSAVATIVRHNLRESEDPRNVGHVTLVRMSRLEPYNRWLVSRFDGAVGRRVLEIGAGFGNITRHLRGRELLVASDLDPVALEHLKGTFRDDPSVRIASYRFPLDPAERDEIRRLRIDSVVCLNVLEHIEDDRRTLADMYEVLEPGGRLVLLVPAFQSLFGTLDVHLRHFRRYEKAELESKIREAGFAIEDLRFVNRPGIFGWWLNGKLLRRRVLPRSQLLAFKLMMPMLEREKENPPTAGLSLIARARKE